jgi:hypothetical protein
MEFNSALTALFTISDFGLCYTPPQILKNKWNNGVQDNIVVPNNPAPAFWGVDRCCDGHEGPRASGHIPWLRRR